jgi:outer membrane protease
MKVFITFIFFTSLLFSKYIETNLITSSGFANEYVNYDRGETLSKLVWKYDNINLINFNFNYNISKLNRLGLFIKYSKDIESGTNTMSDSDWLDENSDKISKYSYHNNTNLNNLEKIDIGILKYIKDYFFVQIGYKSYLYDWTAFGGEYSYKTSDNITNNTKVISYKQNIKMPYILIGINIKNKNFMYKFEGGYSNKVSINTHDTHHLKNRSYYDYFKDGKNSFILFKISYKYNEKLEYFISYSYEKFYKTDGYSITKNDLSNQTLSTSKQDFVSTSHNISNYTFGIKINFDK